MITLTATPSVQGFPQEAITEHAKLACVLTCNNNPRSTRLLHKLLNTPPRKNEPEVDCQEFGDLPQLHEYCGRCGIREWEILQLSDASLFGRCYRLIVRHRPDGEAFSPLWEMAISANIPLAREESIIKHIRWAFFSDNFIGQINHGLPPMGSWRSGKQAWRTICRHPDWAKPQSQSQATRLPAPLYLHCSS